MAAAISAGDLALAMSRANNSARMAGSDMNKFIGYVTTVADVTQKSAESVGESFKTIYSRFGNVKANKFSASVVDQASSSYAEDEYESLNDIETVLTSVGIKLRENAGTWRDIDEVMEEIAQKWKTWDTTTKNAVATVVAGTRQRENVITLFENWEDVAKYAEIAENAYGTATEKMDAYTESIEASRQRLTNAIETFALDLGGSNTLKMFYDQITYIIENLGKFGATIAGILLLTKGPSTLATIGNGLTTMASKIPVFASTKGVNINLQENWDQFKSDKKGYISGIKSSIASNVKSKYGAFKSNLDSKFDETRIVRQQAAYGAALDRATIGLGKEEQMRYRNFQAELLSLNATERNTLATELENGQINASIFSAKSKLSAETKAIIAQQLLTELIQARADQEKIRILQDSIANSNFDQLDDKFFSGLPQTSNKYLRLIGGHMKNSTDPSTTGMTGVLRGLGATAGSIFGMVASNYILESASPWAQIVGSTVGSAIASAAGSSIGSFLTKQAIGLGGVASIIALIGGIGYTVYKYLDNKKKKEAEESFKTAEESYSSAKGMTSTATKFDELAKGVDKFGKNVSLSEEEYSQFLEYSNELCSVFPELISYTDAEGNMIAKIGDEAKSATKKVEELIKQRQNITDKAMLNSVLFNEAADSAYKDYKEGYNKVVEAENKLDSGKKFYGTPLAFDKSQAETMSGYLDILTAAQSNGEDITKVTNIAGENIYNALSSYLNDMGYGVNVETAIANGIDLLSESVRNQYFENILTTSTISKLNNDITIGKKQMAAAQQEMAAYAQAYARKSGMYDGLSSEMEAAVSAMVNNVQFVKEEDGKIVKKTRSEFETDITAMGTWAVDFFKNNPDVIDLVIGEESAKTVGEEGGFRAKLAEVLKLSLGRDGFTGDEKAVLLKFGFEYDESTNVLKNLKDRLQQIADALGVIKSSSILSEWGIPSMTIEESNKLYELITNGWISTSEVAPEYYTDKEWIPARYLSKGEISNLIKADDMGTTIFGAIDYRDRLKKNKITEDDLKLYKESHPNATKELIAADFSNLPTTVRDAIWQAYKEGDVAGAIAAYNTALINASTNVAGQLAKDAFPESEIDGYIDTWKELSGVIENVADEVELAKNATTEFANTGKLSVNTILSLLRTGAKFGDIFTIGDKGQLGLKGDKNQLFQALYEEQGKAIRSNLEANLEDLANQKSTNNTLLEEAKGDEEKTKLYKKKLAEIASEEAAVKALRDLWFNEDGTFTKEFFKSLNPDDPDFPLKKIESILGSINKEYAEMLDYEGKIGNSPGRNVDNYYAFQEKQINKAIEFLDERLRNADGSTMTLNDIMAIEDQDEFEKYMGYYNKRQEYEIKKRNLDEEAIQNDIDLLTAGKASTEIILSETYKLLASSDTEQEYYENYQKYLTAFMNNFDGKIEDEEKLIRQIENAKPQEWEIKIKIGKDNSVIFDAADAYFNSRSEHYKEEMVLAKLALEDAGNLTKKEIEKIVDSYNDAAKKDRQNRIEQAEEKKRQQEAVYNALTNEVNRYIDELENQKEVVEEVYDTEIEKLQDKEESISRTNKLIELQTNLLNAQKEKERVYRAGIGWTYESNRQKVKEAEKSLDDFYRQDSIDDLNNAKDAELKVLDDRIKNWNDYLEMLETKYKEFEVLEEKRLLKELLNINAIEGIKDVIVSDMTTFVTDMDTNYDSFTQSLSDYYTDYNTKFSTFLTGYKNNLEELKTLTTITVGYLSYEDYTGQGKDFGLDDIIDYTVTDIDFAAKLLEATTVAEAEAWAKKRNAKINAQSDLLGQLNRGELESTDSVMERWKASALGQAALASQAERDKLEANIRKDISGYSSGILGGPVTSTGLAMLHGTSSSPEYVLNNDQAYNLLRYMATTKIPSFDSTNSKNSGTQYIVQGDIVLEGVDDPKKFWSEVTQAMGNRWNVTKNR